jgi:peptide deformylase
MMQPDTEPEVLLRARYRAPPTYPSMQIGSPRDLGLHVGSNGWVDTPSQHLHWGRVVLVCVVLVTAALGLNAWVGGAPHAPEEHATSTFHNLSEATSMFAAEIHALCPNASVPRLDDPMPQCGVVSSTLYANTTRLLRSVMAVTNMACMTPLYVGVPLRAVAWTNASNVTTVALNPRIVSMSFEQSLIWEANPMWNLTPVPVQRPHRVHVSYVLASGARAREWLNGTTAHCFQSCIQLCSGQSVHEIY